MTDRPRRVARALLSVSDKSGLIEFARALAGHGVDLVSTGGTAKAIAAAGLKVRDVSELTGFPEMMDGRVKTLHPRVHGGLLAIRDNAEHAGAMAAHGIVPIDLLVVNLYPFEATVDRGADFAACIENIDIGGPAMIRAAAKNHDDVAVVVEPQDYQAVLDELASNEAPPRSRCDSVSPPKPTLAPPPMTRLSRTGLRASSEARRRIFAPSADGLSSRSATARTRTRRRRSTTPDHRPGVATARQVQGRELSYNNINDTDAAYECIAEFDAARTAACVIVKHANPCGVAEGADLVSAYRKALACNSTSAFGGIVALNRTLDAEAARAITEIFTEVIVAPDATEEAISVVATRESTLLLAGALPDPRAAGLTAKTVAGGFLVQSRDNAVVDDMALKVMTKRAPTDAELRDQVCLPRRQACQIQHHRLRQGSRDRRHRRRTESSRVNSARIAARKALDAARELELAEPLTKGSGPWHRMHSSPSPTECWPALRPAPPRLFNPAARYATRRSSMRRTSMASPWCSLE